MCLNLLSAAANRRHTLDFPHPRPPMTIKFNPAPADPASVDPASVDAARARATSSASTRVELCDARHCATPS